jgi:hypothetical protein
VKLHSPAFEKALRRSVKETVRANPELRKESRRQRGTRRRRRFSGPIRLLGAFFLALSIYDFSVTGNACYIDLSLAMITLWTLSLALSFVQGFLRLPHTQDGIALRLFPVDETTIFLWERDRLLQRSLYSLADVAAGLGMLGILTHLPPLAWMTSWLLLSPLAWALMVSLAAFGAARFPKFPYPLILAGMWLIGLGIWGGWKMLGSRFLDDLGRIAPAFELAVPTGWVPSLFHLFLPDGHSLSAFLLLPVGVILSTFPSSLRILRERCVYREWVRMEASDLVPGEEANESTASTDSTGRRVGVTAIEEGILSGQFLAQAEWTQGWLERKLWHWFDQREKTLAEFAFPRGLAITKPWKGILRRLLITLALGVVGHLLNPILGNWIIGIGLATVFLGAGAQIFGTGSAFRLILNGGLNIPVYAAYPITYRALSRMLLKCSTIQIPLFMLLAMTVAISLSGFFKLTWEQGIAMGFKAGLVVYAVRFGALVLKFSSLTNDTSRFRIRTFVLVAFLSLSGVFLIALGAVGILVPSEWISWSCCLAALIMGYGFFRIYGWLYCIGRFDLMSQVR